MKKIMGCWFIITFFNTAFAQDSTKLIINAVKQNEQELLNKMYQYTQFLPGKAFFKNESFTESKFNYSYLTNKILFINPKGDTLELSQGENFSKIVIGVDTFCYYQQQFVQQVSHHSLYNLFLKRSLRYNGTEKKAAYGGYSGTSAIKSYSHLIDNEGSTVTKLTPDENIMYVFNDDYLFSGRFGRFYPATKKGVYELFAKSEKELRDFFKKNKINLDKKEDLYKVLDLAVSILE